MERKIPESGKPTIRPDVLYAICESSERFLSFFENFNEAIGIYDLNKKVEAVCNYIYGRRTWFYRLPESIKDVIREYSDVISIMDDYDVLRCLIVCKYGAGYGHWEEGDYEDYYVEPLSYPHNEEYFCEYVINNYEKVDTIRKIAAAIDDLGFESIILNEDLNGLYARCIHGFSISGVDFFVGEHNRVCDIKTQKEKCISNYTASDRKEIIHEVYDSDYCFEMDIRSYKEKKTSAILRSLTFDPNKLPKEIDVESSYYALVNELRRSKKQEKVVVVDEPIEVIAERIEKRLKNTDEVSLRKKLY